MTATREQIGVAVDELLRQVEASQRCAADALCGLYGSRYAGRPDPLMAGRHAAHAAALLAVIGDLREQTA